MPIWNQFRSILFGGAIGAAARTAIEPQIEPARQLAWSNNRNRILELGALAELVAEGAIAEGDVADLVHRNGFEEDSLRALTEIALHAPDLGTLMQSRRRGDITPGEFSDGLAKLKIKPAFRPAIRLLLDSRLSPADVANAVQQGFVPGAGLLPDDPGGAPPFTPPVEVVPIDTLAEFQAGGVPEGRARVLSQLVGLPPGVMELLDMWNRGIVTETAVEHGIREGHTKTKWTSALKELRHYLLSPTDAAGLRLRGWIDRAEANRLGALRGASPQVMDYLYLNRGRPATGHQIHIGYARGGTYLGENLTERQAFDRGVKNSDIRPEYGEILWAGRYTMPSAFVLRALTQDGTFTEAEAENILLESGWRPDLAKLAATKWAGGTAAGGGKWADRARSRLFTTAHNEFLDHEIDETGAATIVRELGASDAEAQTVVDLWLIERGIFRKDLSQAQALKLYKKAERNRADTFAWLVDHGVSEDDANDLLDAV